ncbi:dynein light chain LC8-type [Vigna unguiculata]|uniref:Dynein light chain LC8-type n=1 Tax=Vigna unguiculata TaxID=3917 RepID=A0A4D6KSL4_VIGUN|nr:dynein light chain LC8-type [Vigna unguiculata]
MANQEKQHKRGFMYIYKGGIGNQKKKELEQDKKSNSRSWLHKISRTRVFNGGSGNRDMDIGGRGRGEEFVEARKSTSCLELGSPAGGFVEGRKSVSFIETAASPAARGFTVEEGRKSVSHIDKHFAVTEMVEARKSVSHIETFSSVAAYLQVKVLVSDMPSFMQLHAFRCARRTFDSLEKFSAKHIAHNVKKEFDKGYGPVWHCIVGSNFGSFVTHSTGCFLYFSMENLYILLFKTKVKKALD